MSTTPATTTTDPGTLAERAARGAALLDQREPGWAARISTDDLAMDDCTECILGQIKGSYTDGLLSLNVSGVVAEPHYTDISDEAHFWAIDHGFSLPNDWTDDKWEDLANAWRAEIRKRTDTRAAS